jgi:hypothetical protein
MTALKLSADPPTPSKPSHSAHASSITSAYLLSNCTKRPLITPHRSMPRDTASLLILH